MRSEFSIFKNTTILLASNVVSKALSALIVIMLARHLTPVGFGEYSFAFAFVTIFIIISDFGLDALVIRDIARDKKLAGVYMEHIGILRILLSIIMIAVSLVIGHLLSIGTESLVIILFAGLIYTFEKLSGLSYAFFRAFERMEFEAISQVIWRLIQIVILLAAIQLGYGLRDIVMMLLVASILKTVISFTLALKIGVKPQRGEYGLLDMMKMSWQFALYEIGYAFYTNIIIVLLYIYFEYSQIGWFSASHKIFILLLMIPVSFETAIFPVLSRLYKEHPSKMKIMYAKSMKLSLLIVIPSTFIIYTFSGEIISILGAEFDSASSLLRLMIFALPFTTLNMIMKTTLWSADRTGITVGNIFASTAALTVISILLMEEFGLEGAVYGFIIGEVILFTLNYYFISKKIYKIGRYIWKPVVAGCAMAGSIYFFFVMNEGNIEMQQLLFISLAVFILSVVSFKTITDYDIQIVKLVLKKGRKD